MPIVESLSDVQSAMTEAETVFDELDFCQDGSVTRGELELVDISLLIAGLVVLKIAVPMIEDI